MRWHRIFFSLLLVFFPTQLGYHFWPAWAMVLGRRVDYLSPTVFLTDILLLLTVGSWLFIEILKIKNQRSEIRIKNQKLIIPVLFLAFSLINILISGNQPVAMYKWMRVLEFGLLGWYVIKTKPTLSHIAFPLSLGVFYSSVIDVAQFFLQHSVGGPLWWLGERTFTIDSPGIARFDFNLSLITYHLSLFGLRPYATFPHPNVLGGFLAATLPLLIFNFQFLIFNQKKKFSIFKTATIVLAIIALVLTFSRSAIVVGIVGVGLLLWQKFTKKKYLVFLFAFILLIAYCLLLIVPNEESVVVRQQLNDAAIKLWQQSPLFGIGLGNFLVELPKALPTRTVYFLQPVHNIYLLILSEIGLIGLALFLWVIKQAVSVKQLYAVRYTLYALLLLGFVDHYLITLQQGQLLFTLILSMNLISRKVQ